MTGKKNLLFLMAVHLDGRMRKKAARGNAGRLRAIKFVRIQA